MKSWLNFKSFILLIFIIDLIGIVEEEKKESKKPKLKEKIVKMEDLEMNKDIQIPKSTNDKVLIGEVEDKSENRKF